MRREEILKEIKGLDMFLAMLTNGDEIMFYKNENGLWIRKCWDVAAYLTDDELAKELEIDYGDELDFIF